MSLAVPPCADLLPDRLLLTERLSLTDKSNIILQLRTPYLDGIARVVSEQPGEPKAKWLSISSQFDKRPGTDGRAEVWKNTYGSPWMATSALTE